MVYEGAGTSAYICKEDSSHTYITERRRIYVPSKEPSLSIYMDAHGPPELSSKQVTGELIRGYRSKHICTICM